MDATVADQMIRFPTDMGLLNEARKISEQLIDKLIRKGIREQLQYLRRNLKHLESMLDQLLPEDAMAFPLSRKLQRKYWIIQQVYAQQHEMYDNNVRRCNDRIVSMVGKLAFVDHLSWDAFNESQDLP